MKRFSNVSIVNLFYIKICRQRNYEGNHSRNYYFYKKVYFEADDLDRLPRNGTDFQADLEYRKLIINHLNQSFVMSSPFGRLVSYIKAFLDKYVELKN